MTVYMILKAIILTTICIWGPGLPYVQVQGASLPQGFIEKLIGSKLTSPTGLHALKDGRILVMEQGGKLKIVVNDQIRTTPVLTLSVFHDGELGLIGITSYPEFSKNNYIYLYYTVSSGQNNHNRVSRFTMSGNTAQISTERRMLDLPDLHSKYHNGGAMNFGGDGYLYIMVGDATRRTQSPDLNYLWGKILRIDKDGTIPSSNPYYNQLSGQFRMIWAKGLRNPFSFTFHAKTNEMAINDVGAKEFEEINIGVAKKDYGWPACEGPSCSNSALEKPKYAYSHSNGECAIVGGTYYDSDAATFPSKYHDKYFFIDHCGGWIKYIDLSASNPTATTFATNVGGGAASMGLDGKGRLLYLMRHWKSGAVGELWAISGNYEGPTFAISVQPEDQEDIATDGTAVFSVKTTGSVGSVTYRWFKDGKKIRGNRGRKSTYTINKVSYGKNNNQKFKCRVTNKGVNKWSREAILTVVRFKGPEISITEPASGRKYNGGDIITFSGVGEDSSGELDKSSFEWEIRFWHKSATTHYHPFIESTTGMKTGSFEIPREIEQDINVWFEIRLTVIGSTGLKTTEYRSIHPRIATIRLNNRKKKQGKPDRFGKLYLDGKLYQAPYTFKCVRGNQRIIKAPFRTYGKRFEKWSDDKKRNERTIICSKSKRSYEALYK